MDQNEYGVLLRHLRDQTRQSGRPDLDSLLLESRLVDAPSSRVAVVEYLRGLRDDMALGSETVSREAMRRIRSITADTGSEVQGIVVDIREQDEAAFGVLQVDLVGSPELDAAVEALDELIEAILADEGLQ